MSIIIHRCSCGHPDVYHKYPRRPSAGHCCYGKCEARDHELGMPEVIPTYVDGQLNEFVHEPGTKGSGYDLCGCPECLALYAEVRNDATPLRAWCIREPA